MFAIHTAVSSHNGVNAIEIDRSESCARGKTATHLVIVDYERNNYASVPQLLLHKSHILLVHRIWKFCDSDVGERAVLVLWLNEYDWSAICDLGLCNGFSNRGKVILGGIFILRACRPQYTADSKHPTWEASRGDLSIDVWTRSGN